MNNHKIKSNNKNSDDNDMEEVENDIYSGIGIKKMKAYKCNLSLEDINNHAKDLLQANNENVIAVKYGSPQAYPNITYCMAFESFFIITLFSGEAAQSFSCVVS